MSYISDLSSSNRAGCSLSRNGQVGDVLLSLEQAVEKSSSSGFDNSCPKILLKPTSVKGLMYFAISRFLVAKIILFREICKKIDRNFAD